MSRVFTMASRSPVGNYLIGNQIGQGNYGQVRLAEHTVTSQTFAVKILPRRFLQVRDYSADVRREMSILMALDHPNIIKLYEVCATGRHLYLFMELATDGDLFTYINEKGPLSESLAKDYFRQILHAVHYCHQRGVYHRDLKPENILLSNSLEFVKLADFGFAAVVDRRSKVHPLLRTSCGSPHYCAPEVWNGEQAQGYDGTKADAFSCGVILYCMLVGFQPFSDSCEDLVLEKVNSCTYILPHSVPTDAGDLIKGLLMRDPKSRLSPGSALSHPWLTSDCSGSAPLVNTHPNFCDVPQEIPTRRFALRDLLARKLSRICSRFKHCELLAMQ